MQESGSSPPSRRKITCSQCGKLYAFVKPAKPPAHHEIVVLERLNIEHRESPLGVFLHCDCGGETAIERGLFPVPQ